MVCKENICQFLKVAYSFSGDRDWVIFARLDLAGPCANSHFGFNDYVMSILLFNRLPVVTVMLVGNFRVVLHQRALALGGLLLKVFQATTQTRCRCF